MARSINTAMIPAPTAASAAPTTDPLARATPQCCVVAW